MKDNQELINVLTRTIEDWIMASSWRDLDIEDDEFIEHLCTLESRSYSNQINEYDKEDIRKDISKLFERISILENYMNENNTLF